ncbi:IS3 family transposase, partial [Pseudoroseomonas wenyumeiae]
MDQQATRTKPRSYTEDYKRQVVDLVVSSGRTPTAVAGEVGLHPTLLCRWVRQYGVGAAKAEAPVIVSSLKPLPVPTADQAAEIARLRRECDRLRMERDILKKFHFDLRGSPEMKFRMVEDCRDAWPVQQLCRVLGISTAGYYAWRSRPDSKRAVEDRALLAEICQAHAKSGGRYGSPRVHAALRADGRRVGRGRIERLMRRHGVRGLVAQRRRVQTTDSRHAFPVAPNLLERQFSATSRPNQVWMADLTYIATGEGWLYMAAIMDLHTRKIVGWSMRDHLRAELATSALLMAIQRQRPSAGLIQHSDRGIQYACGDYQAALTEAAIIPSMSRRANPLDNAPMESFFHTLKTELVHHRTYATRDEAKRDLFSYVESFYNRQRLHSALDYRTPEQAERQAAN